MTNFDAFDFFLSNKGIRIGELCRAYAKDFNVKVNSKFQIFNHCQKKELRFNHFASWLDIKIRNGEIKSNGFNYKHVDRRTTKTIIKNDY